MVSGGVLNLPFKRSQRKLVVGQIFCQMIVCDVTMFTVYETYSIQYLLGEKYVIISRNNVRIYELHVHLT
jgi:hypothetical protein